MRCIECGTEMRTVYGAIRSDMSFVGAVVTPPVEHELCPQCGEIMLSGAASSAMEDAFRAKENTLLADLPIGEYISSDAAASILGKTRQALHQDPRVRLGFVYRMRVGRAWLYHRRSVHQYRVTGDGRFDLASAERELPSFARARVVDMSELYQPLPEPLSRILKPSPMSMSGSPSL